MLPSAACSMAACRLARAASRLARATSALASSSVRTAANCTKYRPSILLAACGGLAGVGGDAAAADLAGGAAASAVLGGDAAGAGLGDAADAALGGGAAASAGLSFCTSILLVHPLDTAGGRGAGSTFADCGGGGWRAGAGGGWLAGVDKPNRPLRKPPLAALAAGSSDSPRPPSPASAYAADRSLVASTRSSLPSPPLSHIAPLKSEIACAGRPCLRWASPRTYNALAMIAGGRLPPDSVAVIACTACSPRPACTCFSAASMARWASAGSCRFLPPLGWASAAGVCSCSCSASSSAA